MAVDWTVMGGYIFPVIRTILSLGIALSAIVSLGYYLFVVKRRRVWHVNVWEKKADGSLQMITKDKLTEKKINKGKQVIYKLNRQKHETIPPPWECVYRVRGKEYCDYLRIADEYVPLKNEITAINNMPTDKKGLINKFKEQLTKLKGLSKKEIEKQYIFIPIHNSMTVEIGLKPMDYDINMMRVNAIDIREKIYADKMDFLSKYGTFIAFGLIIVLIIVVLYMSYEYSGTVIETAMGKASQTLSMVEQLASKMGGAPPAS